MLDSKSPMFPHIMAAGATINVILDAAKRMTIAARCERTRLRDRCGPKFDELRKLGREHFPDRAAIPAAIDAFEKSIEELAGLPGVPDEGPAAELKCPACGAELTRIDIPASPRLGRKARTMIYCSPCLDIIIPSMSALEWFDGFGSAGI
jgi:hypothetical protein